MADPPPFCHPPTRFPCGLARPRPTHPRAHSLHVQPLTPASLVREANLAFLLNTHLFSLINPPAPKPKQRELRYYEKLELKRAAERAAQPPKTLADHLITLAYVSGAVIFGMLLFHVVWPFIRPTVIKHGMPVWEAYGAPLFFGKFVPFWNETFIPWWDKHAYPILSRQLAYSRRAMI